MRFDDGIERQQSPGLLSVRFDAILFDFDGVLLESEYAGNRQIANYLTGIGHPTTPEESMAQFMGLADQDFFTAIERWIGGPIPDDFHAVRAVEDERVLREGLDPVLGAIAFVRSLPRDVPRAVVSSSSLHWISTHLGHLGLSDAFGDMLFSGKDVARGKPAPDLYWKAAEALGVDVARAVIIEDSPVGARGAVASGGHVIGLCAGTHCAVDHAETLRSLGVNDIAMSFEEVARLIA